MSDPGFEPRISGSTVCSLNYTKQYPHGHPMGSAPLDNSGSDSVPRRKEGQDSSLQLSAIACPAPQQSPFRRSMFALLSLVCFLCSLSSYSPTMPYLIPTARKTSNKMKKRQKHGLGYESQSSSCHMMQHEASSDGR